MILIETTEVQYFLGREDFAKMAPLPQAWPDGSGYILSRLSPNQKCVSIQRTEQKGSENANH